MKILSSICLEICRNYQIFPARFISLVRNNRLLENENKMTGNFILAISILALSVKKFALVEEELDSRFTTRTRAKLLRLVERSAVIIYGVRSRNIDLYKVMHALNRNMTVWNIRINYR